MNQILNDIKDPKKIFPSLVLTLLILVWTWISTTLPDLSKKISSIIPASILFNLFLFSFFLFLLFLYFYYSTPKNFYTNKFGVLWKYNPRIRRYEERPYCAVCKNLFLIHELCTNPQHEGDIFYCTVCQAKNPNGTPLQQHLKDVNLRYLKLAEALDLLNKR